MKVVTKDRWYDNMLLDIFGPGIKISSNGPMLLECVVLPNEVTSYFYNILNQQTKENTKQCAPVYFYVLLSHCFRKPITDEISNAALT